jgi:tetratricopeptide (TPR) repeat protein
MDYLKLGNEEMKKNNINKALEYFDKAIQKDKELLEAYYSKLNILTSLDDDKVLNFIVVFLTNFPNERNIQYLQVAYLIKMEQLDTALKLLYKLFRKYNDSYFDTVTQKLFLRKILILKEAYNGITNILDHTEITEDKEYKTIIEHVIGEINNEILKEGFKAFNKNSDEQNLITNIINKLKNKSGIEQLHQFLNKADPSLEYLNKAQELAIQGRHEEVLIAVDKFVKLAPDRESFISYIKGPCLFALGKYEEALHQFNTMIKLWPAMSDAYPNKIVTLIKLNRINELKETLDTAAKANPDIFQFLFEIGVEAYGNGNYEVSIILLKKSEERLTPVNQVLGAMAQMLAKLNRNEEALVYIDKALAGNPNFYPILRLKVEIYFKQGRLEGTELLNICDKLIQLNPNDLRNYLNKAEILKVKGNNKEAIEVLLKAKEINLNEVEIYYALSSLFYYDERFEETKINATKYIEMGGSKAYIYIILGYAQTKLKEHREAIESFEKYQQLNPNDFTTIHNLGYSYLELKDYDKALLYLNKALEVDPKNERTIVLKDIVLRHFNLSISEIPENNKADNNFIYLNKKNFIVLNRVNRNYWNIYTMTFMQRVSSYMNLMKMMKFIKKFK